MPKTSIVIEEKDGLITFSVEHDVPPTGPSETWSLTAQAANVMMEMFYGDMMNEGHKPVFHKKKNAITGHSSIVTREESNETKTDSPLEE